MGFSWFTACALSLALVASTNAVTTPITPEDARHLQLGAGASPLPQAVATQASAVGGEPFERGFKASAPSRLQVDLAGQAKRFTARVGVDDMAKQRREGGRVQFQVIGDGKVLWDSGMMKENEKPKLADVDVSGVRRLILQTLSGGGQSFAVWADAAIEGDAAPSIVDPPTSTLADILTPKPGLSPRINGAAILGVRPGSPLLYTIPATGQRPMTFSVTDIPKGLTVDASTGRITGVLPEKGEFAVTLIARNALGESTKKFKIVVGEQIALTPPLGWNSWNCWAGQVNDERVRASAKGMVDSGLMEHGWSYINIDDAWQGERGGPNHALQANRKFPDMKGLCDYVHGLGLRIGIYSTPWKKSYAGFRGSSADTDEGTYADNSGGYGKVPFHAQDAKQWAEWGIDYLKYDWSPIDPEHTKSMSEALRASGRDIIFSLSNSANIRQGAKWAELSNCWRTTGDIVDTWQSMAGIGFSQDPWKPFAGPGHWNDPDMLVVGRVGWGNPHPSRLSPDEQYTHISLWCLLSAPMLLGCDLAKLDDFTLGLLTNDEVLAVDQDPLGKQAGRVAKEGTSEVWAKELEDGSRAAGLFNRDDFDVKKVIVKFSDLGLAGKCTVRDLWRQKDLGKFDDQFVAEVRPHGVVMVKITPVK